MNKCQCKCIITVCLSRSLFTALTRLPATGAEHWTYYQNIRELQKILEETKEIIEVRIIRSAELQMQQQCSRQCSGNQNLCINTHKPNTHKPNSLLSDLILTRPSCQLVVYLP